MCASSGGPEPNDLHNEHRCAWNELFLRMQAGVLSKLSQQHHLFVRSWIKEPFSVSSPMYTWDGGSGRDTIMPQSQACKATLRPFSFIYHVPSFESGGATRGGRDGMGRRWKVTVLCLSLLGGCCVCLQQISRLPTISTHFIWSLTPSTLIE